MFRRIRKQFSGKPVDLDFESKTKEQLRKHPYYRDICAFNKQCMTKRQLICELENVAMTRPEAVDPSCREGLQSRMWYPRVANSNVRLYGTAHPPNECYSVGMSDGGECRVNTHQLLKMLRRHLGQ